MIDVIKDRTFGILDNFRRVILTCNLNSEIYNQPLWKHIYHAMYWFDYWYATPENFAGADFDCKNLNSLDIHSDAVVSQDDLLIYYERIKEKTINYLENLNENMLNEICENCNGKSRFECILGQFTHACFHLGNVNAITIKETGKWPYVAIRERHCNNDLFE